MGASFLSLPMAFEKSVHAPVQHGIRMHDGIVVGLRSINKTCIQFYSNEAH